MISRLLTLFVLLSIPIHWVFGQAISIDRGIRVGGLWCFPSLEDPRNFRYLPDEGKLVKDENGIPRFSFLRYIDPNERVGAESNTLQRVGGGGIVHLMVEYSTNPAKIRRAEALLREHFEDDSLKLIGPIIFSSGRYSMISSIVNGEQQDDRIVIGKGNAPLFEGSKIAISFEIDPTRSKLLLESFKMPTPDISILFEMNFNGLTDAYEAILEVDWQKVDYYQEINASANLYFVSGEVEHKVKDLFTENAVKLTVSGRHESTEALMDQVYKRLIDLIFEEEQLSKEMENQATDNNLLKQLAGNKSGFNLISAHVGYKYRNIRREGSSKIIFNARNESSRLHVITANLGDIYKEFGDNDDLFKTVNLDDPAFLVRQIMVGVDGDLISEFGRLINNVTIQLVKNHENGYQTVTETRINGSNYSPENNPSISYGWHNDLDRLSWLLYEVKAIYQFVGGKKYETDWQAQQSSMVNLYVPYQRKQIRIEGDKSTLLENGVRAVNIKLTYPFFDEVKNLQRTIRPGDLDHNIFLEMTMPNNSHEFTYEIVWYLQSGNTLSAMGVWSSDILFIDEL